MRRLARLVTRVVEMSSAYSIQLVNLNGREHLEDVGEDEGIVLKWFLNYVSVGRLDSSGSCFWLQKRRGIS
jgi:hypothetical protein